MFGWSYKSFRFAENRTRVLKDPRPFLLPGYRRYVAVQTKVHRLKCAVAAPEDIPLAVRWTKDSDVALSISIVFSGNRNITVEPEPDSLEVSVRAEQRVPDSG